MNSSQPLWIPLWIAHYSRTDGKYSAPEARAAQKAYVTAIAAYTAAIAAAIADEAAVAVDTAIADAKTDAIAYAITGDSRRHAATAAAFIEAATAYTSAAADGNLVANAAQVVDAKANAAAAAYAAASKAYGIKSENEDCTPLLLLDPRDVRVLLKPNDIQYTSVLKKLAKFASETVEWLEEDDFKLAERLSRLGLL